MSYVNKEWPFCMKKTLSPICLLLQQRPLGPLRKFRWFEIFLPDLEAVWPPKGAAQVSAQVVPLKFIYGDKTLANE